MDVYTEKLAQPSGTTVDEASMLSIDDELSQHASMDLDARLNRYFKGKVVRKDLTKQLKEGANVPVCTGISARYVLCFRDDEVVREGLETSKKSSLRTMFARMRLKVKSLIRERGSFKVIDKIGVKLNQKKDVYEAQLSNLGIKDAVIPASIVKANEKLLTGGSGASLLLTIFMKKGKEFRPSQFSTLSRSRCPPWIWKSFLPPGLISQQTNGWIP
jgi:ATP-dependent Lon protease